MSITTEMKLLVPPASWAAPCPGGVFGPEREWWERDNVVVIGVDEAGRGPLAGPVVAGAVAFSPETVLAGIGDSKALTEARRESLEPEVQAAALAWAVAEAAPAEIEQINILQATRNAMARAAQEVASSLGVDYPILLVDGRIPHLGFGKHINVIKGDALSFSIGAASILAKVHRDRLMRALDETHPGYGFARHKGYPTPEHQRALRKLGPCDAHRMEFTIADGRGGRIRVGDVKGWGCRS